MSLARIAFEIKKCRKCGLWKTRIEAVPGEGPKNARLMLIGQAPGKNEDKLGRPFTGRAGKFLEKALGEAGLKRDKVFITSVLKCHPLKNRLPKADEVKSCLPYLERQIRMVKPRKVCLMGNVAIKALLGKGKVGKVHGKKILKESITYIPTYHPAAAMRFPKIRGKMVRDFRKLR